MGAVDGHCNEYRNDMLYQSEVFAPLLFRVIYP